MAKQPQTIYNSRNYYRLLNNAEIHMAIIIYNSRNYYRLLNYHVVLMFEGKSTTVEITIGYLTIFQHWQ